MSPQIPNLKLLSLQRDKQSDWFWMYPPIKNLTVYVSQFQISLYQKEYRHGIYVLKLWHKRFM